MELKTLNHHSAVVLPFYRDRGEVYFVLERKDLKYKPPFFDAGLNFLGGNWKVSDNTPLEVLSREIREEFRGAQEDLDVNVLLGQNFLDETDYIPLRPSRLRNAGAGIIGNCLIRNLEHLANYVAFTKPPIVEKLLTYGVSVFVRPLAEEEFAGIREVIDVFGGIITGDNVRWNSSMGYFTISDINSQNMKFSWAYDHILNDIIKNEGAFSDQSPGVIRPLTFVGATRIQDPELSGDTRFKDFERQGFTFNWSTKK